MKDGTSLFGGFAVVEWIEGQGPLYADSIFCPNPSQFPDNEFKVLVHNLVQI